MLRIRQITVSGYRSIRDIWFPIDQVGVFVGENGVGKSNLYRALMLVQGAATGTLVRDIAFEGGMDSVLWAGPRKIVDRPEIRLELDLTEPDSGHIYRYEIVVRLPTKGAAALANEPQVGKETLTFLGAGRPHVILERTNGHGWAVDAEGARHELGVDLLPSETALSSLQDAAMFPDLHLVRQNMKAWRFWHSLRTDADSALRKPALAVTTTTLASDGSDLAAVFATLAYIKEDTQPLDDAVSDAFPGSTLRISCGRAASFALEMPGYDRPFEAAELSDGTLRFLALAGALLSYRLPPFVALNEPETSLHPSLLPPLARMIVQASRRSQVWLVTHSETLAEAVAQESGIVPRRVVRDAGATWIEGLGLDGFSDRDG